MFEVELVAIDDSVAFTSCAAQWDLGLAAVIGAGGRAFTLDKLRPTAIEVPGQPDLGAVAVDVGGRVWATSPGRIWLHEPNAPGLWSCLWHKRSVDIALRQHFADVGRVVVTTRDGAVVEGRWEPK